ncbi:MAG: heme exporter protein CcmB [Rhodospirillaceae bacterium TMED167]|nr:heme exporter protein CcmB [Rhodospirillaceae bacterium]OUW26419.1 MAG: heme exporter protein CcmB [Rhodospirillaceae bacterium TMED167]
MAAFFAILKRDLKLAVRHGSDSFMVVAFFVLVVVLFPLGVGPEPAMLARISAGVIWVAALLSAMLSMDRLFQQDYEDGSLDLLVLSPTPIELLVLAKVLAHWMTTGLPLIIVSPLLGVFMNMHSAGYIATMVSLALGTPILSLVGAIGAALTLGARRGGVLISLLILPLFIPVLIFGVSAVEAALTDLTSGSQFLVLSAMLLAALPLAPYAAAAALRQAVE